MKIEKSKSSKPAGIAMTKKINTAQSQKESPKVSATAVLEANSAAVAAVVERSSAVKTSNSAPATSAPVIVPTASTGTNAKSELTFESISYCAYFIWEKEGYPHSRDQQNWFAAEKILRNRQS